jgi:hypothetical protein
VDALALLDDGMNCAAIAKVMLPDDAPGIGLYQENGIEGPASFGYEGGACRDCPGDRSDEVPSQTPQHPGHLEPIERLRGLEVPRN